MSFSGDVEVCVRCWRRRGNHPEGIEINPFVLNVKKTIKACFLDVLVLLVHA